MIAIEKFVANVAERQHFVVVEAHDEVIQLHEIGGGGARRGQFGAQVLKRLSSRRAIADVFIGRTSQV